MDVTSATSTAASASSLTSNTSRATIAQNFDQFLTLLTTQLRNQNPLDPLDANQFTQQLVAFAGVEQQLKTNDGLERLIASTATATVTNALGFVGARIIADGSTTKLSGGRAEWRLDASRAGNASIVVTDKNNNVVHTETRGISAGQQTYAWNGRTTNGTLAPDGEYKITIAASDANGQPVTVKTEVAGTVDQVDLSDGNLTLKVGSLLIPADKVKSITRGSQSPVKSLALF